MVVQLRSQICLKNDNYQYFRPKAEMLYLTCEVLLILFSFLKVADVGVQKCGDFDRAEEFCNKLQHPRGRYCLYQVLLYSSRMSKQASVKTRSNWLSLIAM